MAPGGANFCTRVLMRPSSFRLSFRISIPALLFALVFLLPGVALLLAAPNLDPIWLMFLFGFIFAAAGAGLLLFWTQPVVFDRSRGYYWRGWRRFADITRDAKRSARLDDIVAIQLLGEHVTDSDGDSYTSYELNLVLKSGERVHVVDHGSHTRISKDADTLAAFLKVPLRKHP